MGNRFPTAMVTVAIAAGVLSTAISGLATETWAQTALSTPWGEPDLQGIWTEEFDTPLRPLAIPLHSFRTRQIEGMGRSDERGVRDLGERLQRNVVLLPADQVVTASRTSSRAWRVMASRAAPALQGRTYHAHDTPMQMVQYVEPALRSGQGGYSA